MEPSPRPTASPNPTTVSAKPTLLFVDDEERILRSLRLMFAQSFNVRTTTSGVEALQILKQEKVHALISDQRMPIMPGVALLREARNISPNTMRLLLTGYSDLEAVTGSINDGEIYRYISKPWNPDDIRATINEAVEIALSLDTLPSSTTTAPARSGNEAILVIDTDPATRRHIQSLLEEHHPGKHQVEWAADLDAVFTILERTEVALVITEVALGATDLTDLVKSLKRHNPNVVTLVLTGVQDSTTLVGLINQAQIHRYLLKPIRRSLLLRAIESGLERYRACQAVPVLARRHQVEAPPASTETPVAKRIFGFFRRLGSKA